LFLVDRNLEGLLATKDEILSQSQNVLVETCEVDISDENEVDKMIEKCVAAFSRVDYALNVAGVVPMRTLHAEVDIGDYDKTITINEYGVCTALLKSAMHRADKLQDMALPAKSSTADGQTRTSARTSQHPWKHRQCRLFSRFKCIEWHVYIFRI
jgi:NADP-dependent 3-hydroxy acid dehydrogenase YdfG